MVWARGRRGRLIAECSMAGRGEIVEDVALLLTQSITDGEHAFDEAASGLCVPKLVCRHRTPCRRVLSASLLVGSTPGLHTKVQGGLDIEEIATGGRRLSVSELVAPSTAANVRRHSTGQSR